MSSALKLLGVLSPSSAAVANPAGGDPPLVLSVAPAAAVGLAGVALWPEHRLLGLIAGEAVGGNAYRLWRGQGDDRVRAVGNLFAAGTGVAGSLMWQKHPFLGWFIGFAVGSAATALVKGTNAHRLISK